MDKKLFLKYYIKAKYVLFPITNNKVPLIKNWQNKKFSEAIDKRCESGNFGIALQEDDLVIDVDPRHFIQEDKPHSRLSKMFPEIKDTFIVQTGRGGLHIYLKKPKGFAITRKHHPDFIGLDFLRKGDFVVGAGSIHLETKKEYKIVRGNLGGVVTAPPKLIEMLQSNTGVEPLNKIEFVNDEQTYMRFVTWLKTAPIAISGQGGNDTTFKIACRGRAFGLSADFTLNAMNDWNKRCKPVWDDSKLLEVVNNAYKYNEEPIGKLHPRSDFDDVKPEQKKKRMLWHITKRNEWKVNSLHNVTNFFTGYENSLELKGLLRFNLLSHSIEFIRKPFWISKREVVTPWDDNDANAVAKFLSTKLGFNTTKNMIHDAALAVAQANKYHPIMNYLESLKWDGKHRVCTWFHDYLETANTKYERAVGELMLVAAIKRIYQSGCKYKTIIVLEGDQGAGKSPVCEIMGGEWYADMTLNVHSPDTVDAMKTKWIIEVSEMECTKRAETQALKAFLSRQVDTCRLAYARAAKDFPRHNIFIGTFNPDNAGGYLKDMSGNTRYLPILIPRRVVINLKKLQKDRDQLWAEALVIYKSNPKVPLYLYKPELAKLAVEETEKRRLSDAWLDKIRDWLDNPEGNNKPKEFARADEIYVHAIGGDIKNLSNFEFHRIANVMQDLGWGNSKGGLIGKKRQRAYIRPRPNPIKKEKDLMELL